MLGVRWVKNAPGGISPAYAFRTSGTRIALYQDRLGLLFLQEKDFVAAVLGHILAHEIGHVLLGHNSHSPAGLMKSC